MHDPNLESTVDTLGVDRRTWARYPASETLSLMVDGRTYGGILIDESIGGVALTVKDANAIEIETKVELSYGDVRQVGYVTAVEKHGERKFRLSIGWTPRDGTQRPRDYMFHRHLAIACKVLAHNGDRYTVELANGKHFTVSARNVRPQSIEERTSALANMRTRDLRVVADMYGICRRTTPSDMMDDILRFEFGIKSDDPVLSALG